MFQKSAYLMLGMFAGMAVLATVLAVGSSEPARVIMGYTLGALAGIGISPVLWPFVQGSYRGGQSPVNDTSYVAADDVDDDDDGSSKFNWS